MPPLTFLQGDNPNIDANFFRFCASRGIFSVEEFLLQDLHTLVDFAEQDPTGGQLKKGITQVLSFVESLHQPWFNGLELLEDAEQKKSVLSTGFEGIDFLLQGGLHKGQLVELVGPSSSGKTQVCMQVASYVAVKYTEPVVFFDSCNSFSAKRIMSLMKCLLTDSNKEVLESNLEEAMSRILCHSVFDIFGLLQELNQLERAFGTQVRMKENQMQLLIVDSISSLIAPVLGGRDPYGHSLMTSTGFFLKKLANAHNLSVLVTNHTVGGERGTWKPALGESWKSVPHVRLSISSVPGTDIHELSVLKHASVACGLSAKFVMPG